MSVRTIGDVEGRRVHQVRIAGGGLSAEMMEWGCVMRALRLDGVDRSLILGLPKLEDYIRLGDAHIGAVAGRCANRIAGGAFAIDGERFQADRNVDGRTTLHGGAGGFGRSLWRLVDHGPAEARFAIRHEDGEQGFPGAIEAVCQVSLEAGALVIEMTAKTDAPTLCNLAQHNYYNLSGAARIDDHEVTLASSKTTPLNDDLVPVGVVAAAPAALDFTRPCRLGDKRIDVNFVLADARKDAPAFAARLRGGDVEMTLETTEPGLQVYTSDSLSSAAPGADPRAGICLEPQLWPDAPNHPGFPSAVLRPGETYRQTTVLRFGRSGAERLNSSDHSPTGALDIRHS